MLSEVKITVEKNNTDVICPCGLQGRNEKRQMTRRKLSESIKIYIINIGRYSVHWAKNPKWAIYQVKEA